MTLNPPTVQRSRLVSVITGPLGIREFTAKIADLEAEHGPGLRIGNIAGAYEIRTPGIVCGCRACEDEEVATYQRLTGRTATRRMNLCPDCGNKRCPRATQHDQECSGSNLPGQSGSRYA